MTGGEVKISTVSSEGIGSNTSTLPATSQSKNVAEEKPKASVKEKFAKKSQPHFIYHQIKRTSMFVVLSMIYGKLLVVTCIAFVISQQITQSLPTQYYEGFFTYLYGGCIFYLMYVFCFLLQESACCRSDPGKKKKDKKNAKKDAKSKKTPGEIQLQGMRTRPNVLQGAGGTLKRGTSSTLTTGDDHQVESSPEYFDMQEMVSGSDIESRKRKTTQHSHHHGSFYLRVGAIGYGLGTMIYNGLETGKMFETPMDSSCWQLLRALNPILQMVFTFMQMYFIFMNARLKIHRFKAISRFGLMHIIATNICIWIRTMVIESLNQLKVPIVNNSTLSTLKSTVRNLSAEYDIFEKGKDMYKTSWNAPSTMQSLGARNMIRSLSSMGNLASETAKVATDGYKSMIMQGSYGRFEDRSPANPFKSFLTTAALNVKETVTESANIQGINALTTPLTTIGATVSNVFKFVDNNFLHTGNYTDGSSQWNVNPLANLQQSSVSEALVSVQNLTNNGTCERINIMGTIVEDAAPFLYPLIVQYSLIGAAVIYVMWRHIGRSARYVSEENIEHKLEAMLAQRAVAMAQAQNGSRIDCVGASKGLFFGLLLLVGSLICLILYFVLIHHEPFSLLAIYLADVSHCVIMALSILAIIIGFIRAKNLKFYPADSTLLNDILQRASAFGLFVYSIFTIISGVKYAATKESHLLVMTTGAVNIVQVILQLIFIGDMSKRHVSLTDHGRNKPGRQIVTFLLISNITMCILFTFEAQKVLANPVQLNFYGHLPWTMVQYLTLPLCIFHRFHSAVALAEIWKNAYKPVLE